MVSPDHRALLLQFTRLDRIGAIAGFAFVTIANLTAFREATLYLAVGALGILIVALTLAERTLTSPDGSPAMAIALIAIGNWATSIVVPIPVPFLWAPMVLVALMPVVLAAAHLDARRLAAMIAAGAAVVAATATIGLLGDDSGIVPDIEDVVEIVLVVAALIAIGVPIGLVVWQTNRLHRRATTDLQRSRRRVVAAADDARSAIERDLHDGAQQRLVALGMRLRRLEAESAGDDELHGLAASAVTDLDVAITELRSLAHGIYPPLLGARGLNEAMAAMARSASTRVDFTAGDIGRFDRQVEATAYFVASEALTNAAKHAPDATVLIELTRAGRELTVRIADDGPGFDTTAEPRSAGLVNMADRISALGGRLDVNSSPGDGTTIVAAMPIGVEADPGDES